MKETLEQRAERLERVVGTLRRRLSTCREKRVEQGMKHEAELTRVREARDSYRDERNRLKSHFDLLAADGSHGRYSGCYILKSLGVAIYVGQSINVFARIAGHRGACSYPSGGVFDEVRVIWCAVDELNATERRLIEELRPPLNSEGVTRPYAARRHPNRLPTDLFGPVFLATVEA
jgi:hypothetical protein